MKKILVCVGTRPNLIKVTQLEKEFLAAGEVEYKLLHTGQHYDFNMNDVFFQQLQIRKPDVFLNANQGSQIEVIAHIMTAFEKFLLSYQPDIVLVPGDVNSTFACAFVASRHHIPVAHIESGLRSFDMTMPEEVNRILTDAICDLYFITEASGQNNLLKEGKPEYKLKMTGNSMIDSLIHFMPQIEASDIRQKLKAEDYVLLTFHRPANVDDRDKLKLLAQLIVDIAESKQVVFPIHPRTLKNLKAFDLIKQLDSHSNIIFTEPLGYFEFIHLVKYAHAIITDSGGVQEESTFLQVPCLTVRENTERPVTISTGTNTLVPLELTSIKNYLSEINDGTYKEGSIPPLWDGKASQRIVQYTLEFLDSN